jgi:HD superfamily phosphohydrolase
MFNAVYTHKTIFAFEELTRKIIFNLWKKGQIYKSGDDIENLAKADNEDFLKFDDSYLDNLINKYANDHKDKKLAEFCKCVKFRHPPKLVYEISELTQDGNNPSEKCTIFKRGILSKIKDFTKDKDINIPEDYWLFADIKTATFGKIHPFMSLSEVKKLVESGEHDQVSRELVKLKDRSGNLINLIEDPGSIFNYLSRLNPSLCRLYVIGIDDSMANLIKNKIEAWLSE